MCLYSAKGGRASYTMLNNQTTAPDGDAREGVHRSLVKQLFGRASRAFGAMSTVYVHVGQAGNEI